jgi:bifunctional DNA-binding transcriptional regulator/antitoxin component of YhaV-PrlF toxin-antitoxin module
MPTVIVDEEGRICLPQNYHAVLDIRPGSRLVLDMADDWNTTGFS